LGAAVYLVQFAYKELRKLGEVSPFFEALRAKLNAKRTKLQHLVDLTCTEG